MMTPTEQTLNQMLQGSVINLSIYIPQMYGQCLIACISANKGGTGLHQEPPCTLKSEDSPLYQFQRHTTILDTMISHICSHRLKPANVLSFWIKKQYYKKWLSLLKVCMHGSNPGVVYICFLTSPFQGYFLSLLKTLLVWLTVLL